MPWTESRTRQEWLDEVKRRGERLRRRRRLTFATLAAIALLLPATALATFLGGTSGSRDINLAVAGPPPTGDVAGAGADTTASAPDETTTTTAESQLRVEAVHGRTESPTPGLSVPGDDPVLRRPGATNPAPSSGNSSDPNTPISSEPALPPPPTVSPPTSARGAANCPSSEVRVTVTTDKTTYAPGETVSGSTTIANRSASACLLPTRGFVRIMNAAGRDVSGFAYTMEYRFPVLAAPGKTFTTPFTWDQRDCSGSACVQVPAGTYNVAADWTEGGQYFGRGSFTIGG